MNNTIHKNFIYNNENTLLLANDTLSVEKNKGNIQVNIKPVCFHFLVYKTDEKTGLPDKFLLDKDFRMPWFLENPNITMLDFVHSKFKDINSEEIMYGGSYTIDCISKQKHIFIFVEDKINYEMSDYDYQSFEHINKFCNCVLVHCALNRFTLAKYSDLEK